MLRLPMLLAASLALIVEPAGRAQTAPRTRAVYVSAIDGAGRAVVDLSPADLVLKEDGRVRPIATVARAVTHLSIAMLVDDSGVGMNDVRAGVAGFINRLGDQAAFSIVGIAEQNRTIVDYTSQSGPLQGAIRLLIPRNVSAGGHLVEGVLEAATAMTRQERQRPVLLILTNQGREDSDIPADRAMAQVARAGAAIYVVEVLRPAGQARPAGDRYDTMAGVQAERDQARNIILGDGPRLTGGRRAELIATADVPRALAGIAGELAGQSVVTYQSEARPGSSSKIEIAASRRGIKVRAPARNGDRVVR